MRVKSILNLLADYEFVVIGYNTSVTDFTKVFEGHAKNVPEEYFDKEVDEIFVRRSTIFIMYKERAY